MGDCPSNNHTIERIENDKGYYKENCRWATTMEQSRNRRNNVFVMYNGEKILLIELSEKLSIPKCKLYSRIFVQKWSVEKAIYKK